MNKLLLLTLLQIFLLANEKIDYNNLIFKDKAFKKLLEEQLVTGAESFVKMSNIIEISFILACLRLGLLGIQN